VAAFSLTLAAVAVSELHQGGHVATAERRQYALLVLAQSIEQAIHSPVLRLCVPNL
jgi:hypothetical protein